MACPCSASLAPVLLPPCKNPQVVTSFIPRQFPGACFRGPEKPAQRPEGSRAASRAARPDKMPLENRT